MQSNKDLDPDPYGSGSKARLRRICLALPEAEERITWDAPTFRVRDKIFALAPGPEGLKRDGAAVWVKAPRGSQALLIEAAPERFFAPPYLGPKGWVGIRINAGTDWQEVTALVRRSYRLVAPRRLALLVPEESGED
jgi:predicted DNA-binding protein (MmcQ/YjbR family)